MKWLLIVVLSLVGLLLLIVLVGALLPQKHHVSRTVTLRQSVETVWSLISGPPTWRSDITNYQNLPPNDGRHLWRETDKHGQTITYETVESSAPRKLVVRIADPKLPFGGTWTYDLAPSPSGCSLTITEDGEVYNPLFRFVSRFIMGHTATIDSYVNALQQKLGS